MPDPRHQLGLRAESSVAAWLESRGWSVLARRWRCARGELDIVCRDPDGALVAVEVKMRTAGRAGSGADALVAARLRQVRRLRAALGAYLEARPLDHHGLRVDLVEVRPADVPERWRLRHLRGVDGW